MAIPERSEPPHKQPKPSTEPSHAADVVCGGKCLFTRVPLELLAEILMYTRSPADLLSIARCNKYFCATLVGNPSSDWIWRAVRKLCLPCPVPDPTANFSEAGYASFLFDGGECEVCKAPTNEMHVSFALRLRLCKAPRCRTAFIRDSLIDASTAFTGHESIRKAIWVPHAESSRCFAPYGLLAQNWPDVPTVLLRRSDWIRFSEEYHTYQNSPTPAIEKRREAQIKRLPQIMALAVVLTDWKEARDKMRRSVKAKNHSWTQALARREGWNIHDLLNCRSYGSLHRLKTNVLEELKPADLRLIINEVEPELLHMAERRKRCLDEKNYRRRRTEVKQHFQRLKSEGHALPPLAEFRNLPVIKLIQGNLGKSGSLTQNITGDLKTSRFVEELFKEDLKKWVEPVQEALSSVLGYPKWKSASTNKLHPVKRLTARFKCKRCNKVGRKYSVDGCFDFEGVCAHDCPYITGKDAKDTRWRVENFVKDEKAIDAVSKALALCGIKEEDPNAALRISAIGAYFRCLSCKAIIKMDFKSIIGHSQRHDSMQLELVPEEEELASVATFPMPPGLSAKLMSPSHRSRKQRESRVFGCRHCLEVGDRRTATVSSNAGPREDQGVSATAASAAPSGAWIARRTTRWFDFNSLRSHAKSKHSIQTLRDEDIHCSSADISQTACSSTKKPATSRGMKSR